MKRKIFFTLIVLSFLGCTPHSINPVTHSANKILDNRFDGTWVAQDNSGCFQVKSLKDGMIEIKTESNSEYNSVDYIVATVYDSIIKNNHYLSIQVHNIADLENGYLIAKYSLDDFKTLKFAYIDTIALKHLILSKNIKGDVNEKGFSSSIITDTSVNIERVINEYDNLLFKNYMIFNKGNCPSKR